jgi:hypothetical protein
MKCYKCLHRGELPGSAHSRCNHPAFGTSNPLNEVLAILGSVGRGPGVRVEAEGCKVEGHPHGIKNGWFQHPYNFDPAWLVSCTGFVGKRIRRHDE